MKERLPSSEEETITEQTIKFTEVEKDIPLSEDFEARHNAVGFFDLLIKIDKRINPQNYIRPITIETK